jgi:hypothetical protein
VRIHVEWREGEDERGGGMEGCDDWGVVARKEELRKEEGSEGRIQE